MVCPPSEPQTTFTSKLTASGVVFTHPQTCWPAACAARKSKPESAATTHFAVCQLTPPVQQSTTCTPRALPNTIVTTNTTVAPQPGPLTLPLRHPCATFHLYPTQRHSTHSAHAHPASPPAPEAHLPPSAPSHQVEMMSPSPTNRAVPPLSLLSATTTSMSNPPKQDSNLSANLKRK